MLKVRPKSALPAAFLMTNLRQSLLRAVSSPISTRFADLMKVFIKAGTLGLSRVKNFLEEGGSVPYYEMRDRASVREIYPARFTNR